MSKIDGHYRSNCSLLTLDDFRPIQHVLKSDFTVSLPKPQIPIQELKQAHTLRQLRKSTCRLPTPPLISNLLGSSTLALTWLPQFHLRSRCEGLTGFCRRRSHIFPSQYDIRIWVACIKYIQRVYNKNLHMLIDTVARQCHEKLNLCRLKFKTS